MARIRPEKNDTYLELLKDCLTASIYQESAWERMVGHPLPRLQPLHPARIFRVLFRNWILWLARKQSWIVVRPRPMDSAIRTKGQDWPLFGYTMIGRFRLDNIEHIIGEILKRGIPGDLIETGAWRGGATIFMRAVLKQHGIVDRRVWVADSFEGLPRPNPAKYGADADKDYNWDERLKVSIDQVKANFARFGLLDDQVKFLKGWFRDTLPGAPIKKLALLRLDGDLYESTIDALQALYHRVSPGGFVIIDDYHSWPSCRKAVTEFRREMGIEAEIRPIDEHAVYWKVPGGD